MTYYPYAMETGGVYKLTNPNGAIAVFNDPTDPNYVGMLSEVTGLDSPDVRESADDLVQADGGTHGAFYFGRRPITMTGTVFGHNSVAERNTRMDRARRASMAVRTDSTLSWKPSLNNQSGFWIEMFVPVRRQQPFRESGAWNKQFQIALVSEYAQMFSTALHTASGAGGSAISVENQGSWPAYPLLKVTGISTTDFTITNNTTGEVLRTTGGLQMEDNTQTVTFDTLNHTASYTDGSVSNVNIAQYVNFATTAWPTIPTGTSTFTLSGTGTLTVTWRDTWV